MGHKRTFRNALVMSALPPKAGIFRHAIQCPLCAMADIHTTPCLGSLQTWDAGLATVSGLT
jgi:hypothetical protein